MTPLASHLCPLCGRANDCAPAACGRFDVACWCRDARFPAELLARLAPEARGRACICASCAAAASEAQNNPERHPDGPHLHG